MVDVLRARSEKLRTKLAFTFLLDGEDDEVHLSFGQLDDRARRIAACLQRVVAPGERAILLYPPGVDFITAFFGCLYAGVVTVPCYPPDAGRLRMSSQQLQAVVRDSQPAIVLTTAAIEKMKPALCAVVLGLGSLTWQCTDRVEGVEPGEWREKKIDAETIALLQYTSGSTATPKGVVIRHGNLMANQRVIRTGMRQDAHSTVVGWLPMYHDMGLIGNV